MISKIIWYFWTYADKLSFSDEDDDEKAILKKDLEIKKQRIVFFWDQLYRKYKDINANKLNENGKKLISDSIKLMGVLDNLDEESVKRIRFALPYIEASFNVYHFI